MCDHLLLSFDLNPIFYPIIPMFRYKATSKNDFVLVQWTFFWIVLKISYKLVSFRRISKIYFYILIMGSITCHLMWSRAPQFWVHMYCVCSFRFSIAAVFTFRFLCGASELQHCCAFYVSIPFCCPFQRVSVQCVLFYKTAHRRYLKNKIFLPV